MLYWQRGELVFENFALDSRIVADPLVFSILQFCGRWRSLAEITSYLNHYSESSIQRVLQELCANQVLEGSNQKGDPRLKAMERWAAWNPAAGFFHFSTKDTRFAPDQWAALEQLKAQARHAPMPLPVKNYRGTNTWKLPWIASETEFPAILKNRRTWRKFGHGALPLEKLAQALQLTFGIQRWVRVPGLGRAALKTSPSGGCLHPVEAYVLAQRVKGLPRGLYHYNAASHRLEWIREGPSQPILTKNLGYQWWFAKAPFLVLMTVVFGRTRWKYDFPRAYRSILIEAGHLCQTFCLTSTWLGLAPFSTIAYTDTQWEKWLGLDGISESVIYVAGAGMRPTNAKGMRDAHIGTVGTAF